MARKSRRRKVLGGSVEDHKAALREKLTQAERISADWQQAVDADKCGVMYNKMMAITRLEGAAAEAFYATPGHPAERKDYDRVTAMSRTIGQGTRAICIKTRGE